MISEKHPGFIINTGEAKYEDIKYLIDLATDQVKWKFGIDLELEWKIIQCVFFYITCHYSKKELRSIIKVMKIKNKL